MPWLTIGRFLLKHWLPILALVLLTAALGYAFHKGAQGERDKVALKAAAAEKKALQVALERAKASAEAAQAARERNDTEIPRIRTDTQGRVARAATADVPARVRDVQAALSGLDAARSAVRGTGAR